TGSGAFGIARDSGTGLPYSIYDGTLEMIPGFNAWAEMDALDYQIQSVSKASWGLTFDPYSAEITAKTESVAGTTTTYGYDYSDLGQLEEVTKNSTIVEEYLYDANGNREYQKVNGIERWLSYDAEDRLEGIFSDEPKTVQVADYDYDVDGFLTAKTDGSDVTTYDYSSLGELLSVTLPDSTEIEYLHDALGRRVAKKVDGDISEKYLWAGINQGLLAVYDGADNLILRFEYAGGRLPMAMTYDSATYYLAYDQVGSLRAVFDTSGNNVHEISYDSFGNILSDGGSLGITPPFGFAGGLHDRDTGLVRFGFRDYDPNNGRWTAKDPIGFAGGDVNLYAYVVADPISFVDPSGERFGWNVVTSFAGGFWDSLQDNSYAAWHPFAPDAWERSSIGQAWANRDRYPVESYGAMAGAGAAVGATGAAVCIIGGETAVAGGGALFRPGGLVNSNRYLRVGIGRQEGWVFRIAGDWVARFRSNPHIDLFRIWWRK
ncbi:MAG: hypothetical protein HYV26_20085, partial [Candidatus Hydrogenedentes bacterium]|nr:hypothetical protein [Candidatus Hydrogenedentota bacterium]